ncbi:MAG: SGNH/GDSL hydrolase family protein [Planctomycetes bacterium]|nr:SGNH/GDSL hydrolase family protein [Planctomycetota bacterium]
MTAAAKQSDSNVLPRRRKRWLPRIGLLIGSLLIAAVLADVTVRMFGLGPPAYEPRRYEPDGRVPFAQIPNGPITYQPNARFASVYDDRVAPPYTGGRVEYAINSFGFRGPEIAIEKKPGITRIACLGDSFTFGEGVREDSVWPRSLEEKLNDEVLLNEHGFGKPPDTTYEVLNCGVQGHGTIDEFLYYRMHVSQFKPDIVILGFFLNDVMEGRETLRQNEEWTKAREVSAFARWSRIAEILERRQIAAELQADYFAAIRTSFESPRWELSKRAMTDLKSLTTANGQRLIVVVWPVLWKLDSGYPFEDVHHKITAFCKDGEIECVDLLDTFRGSSDYKFWVHPTDHHPNGLAHGSAAYSLFKHFAAK